MFSKPTNGVTTDYPQQMGRLIDVVEGPAYRNFIRNGDFMIAQRGASIAGITAGGTYTLDGWLTGGGGTSTVTQQAHTIGQTDVPGNPQYFLQLARTVAAGADNDVLQQRIEAPERLSGRTVTVGFYARVTSGTKTLKFDLASSGVTPTIDTSDNDVALTTTWAYYKFTVSVPAMTASGASAYLAWRLIERTTYGTFTLQISDVQLEAGSEGTYFERLNVSQQIAWNQRYFCKSFAMATTPAQNVGLALCEHMHTATKAGAAVQYGHFVAFPVRMRANGTVTFYNPSAANAQIRDIDASADCSSTSASSANERGFWPITTGNASTAVGNRLAYNWSATAEL